MSNIFKYQHYTVKAEYKGNKPALWAVSGQQNWNHHKITVKNTKTGKQASFDFWASQTTPCIEGSKYDTLNAMSCWIDDALSAKDYSLDEFAEEFGYTKPSEAIKVYKGCEKSLEQVERVIDSDLYDFINKLNERYG